MQIINQPTGNMQNMIKTFDGKRYKMSDDPVINKNNKNLKTALISITTLGVVTTAVGVLSKKSRAQMLDKAGLEIKNARVINKLTGENFTGSLTRNTSAFGLKKEVNSFENGVLTEILNYGFRGKELDGYFYKNGKLLYRSGVPTGNSKIKYYPWFKYKDSDICLHADCKLEPGESVFENMRKLMDKEL